MRRRKQFWRRVCLWAAAAVIGLALAAILLRLVNPAQKFTLSGTPEPHLAGESAQVHFIDIGQADSTLLRQGKAAALIDAGTVTDGPVVTSYLKAQSVRQLDYLVLTHFHADHIGGALQVLDEFKVNTVLIADLELGPMPTSSTALLLLERLTALAESGKTRVLVPAAGDKFTFGKGQIQVLGAGLTCKEDLNNTSLITLFQFDNFSFYAGGDSEAEAELAMLAGTDGALHAALLKVPHHGSYTSCTPELVQQLQPQAAVVSCGFENEYGHPHSVTLNTLKVAGAQIFRTDLNGTVVATVKDGVMSLRAEKGGWPYEV